ncbi:MAG: GAF domain-containing protein [Deltaproteobacteria bacterium]|nr:GAF domain-containing protein [Deltaproteobacteria bacterium]
MSRGEMPAADAVLDPQVELRAQAAHIARLEQRFEAVVNAVIPIGVALLGARDYHALLERILVEAKTLCRADGGTLYLRNEQDQLEFVILRNDSLGIELGGSGGEITFPALPLFDPVSGEPNERNVATYAALHGLSVAVADAYDAEGFEFSGTLAFDRHTGYRSTSFLAVPLKNSAECVIGVLQFINALDEDGTVVAFDAELVPVVESLSTLAAAALEVYLREDHLRREIRALHVKIDEVKRAKQVAEIADTDYFRELEQKARSLRQRR